MALGELIKVVSGQSSTTRPTVNGGCLNRFVSASARLSPTPGIPLEIPSLHNILERICADKTTESPVQVLHVAVSHDVCFGTAGKVHDAYLLTLLDVVWAIDAIEEYGFVAIDFVDSHFAIRH